MGYSDLRHFDRRGLTFLNSKGIKVRPQVFALDYFSATPDERTALWAMMDEAKKLLDSRFKPDGYNVGINVGTPAGQTVLHCHIHLIPQRSGDSVNPRGGVRGVIAGKADYSGDG